MRDRESRDVEGAAYLAREADAWPGPWPEGATFAVCFCGCRAYWECEACGYVTPASRPSRRMEAWLARLAVLFPEMREPSAPPRRVLYCEGRWRRR